PRQRGQESQAGTLRPELEAHREQFAEFVRENAQGAFSGLLRRLYAKFYTWNADYFGGKVLWPHILLAEPKSSRAWGDYSATTGWGSRGQIRIRPSLYDGSHRQVQPGSQYAEGRILLVEDVLLHESIHLFNDEVLGQPEDSYHGHGPAFRDRCN